MKRFLFYIIIVCSAFCSCRNNEQFSVPQASKPFAEIYNDNGKRIRFTYDPVKQRYTNWYYHYAEFYYDSTFVYYNGNDMVSHVVNVIAGLSTPDITVQILNYNTLGQLSCIYTPYIEVGWGQRPDFSVLPVIRDIGDIRSVDTFIYNNRQQLIKIKQFGIDPTLHTYSQAGGYNLSYAADNDSILKEVLAYFRDDSTDVNSRVQFNSFDTMPNPFYNSSLRWHALLRHKTQIPVFPSYSESTLSDFAAMNPHNCKSVTSGGETFYYEYKYRDSLPYECRTARGGIDFVSFIYKQ